MEKKSTREYGFDFLKAAIILTVVVHHYQSKFGCHFGPVDFGHGRFYFGYMAEILFIISGYFSFASIKRIKQGLTFKKYFLTKYFRLVPVAAICTIVYALIFVLFRFTDITSVWDIYLTVLGVQAGGAFTVAFINSHLWYSSVLLICYVVLYAATDFCSKKGLREIYAYGLIAILGVCIISSDTNLPFLNWSSARGYMAFFTGVVLAELLNRKCVSKWFSWFCAAVIAALTGLMALKWQWMENGTQYIMTFIYYPALVVVLRSEFCKKVFRAGWWGTVSQIAFNVYIWHLEILTILEVLVDRLSLNISFNSFGTECWVVLLQIAVGTVSYFGIDRPLGRLLNNKVLNKITD